ncbi:MAG TPA: MBL fold metallo-hydrolase [Solirubrobacteraceae bacterium]|nr:MBL fold metallo-hydrolase [Solirubrobacteraceae bacterium]
MSAAEEILPGLWRLTALHPDWEEGEDWDAEVSWWALRSPDGLALIDPLVERWEELDQLVADAGGCAGIIRTLHYHERSIPGAAARYGAAVWARAPTPSISAGPADHAVPDGPALPGGVGATPLVRDDELALWLPEQRALAFGDAMLRDSEGRLSMCPESWVTRAGGRARLREDLLPLVSLAPRHVLVSHGPLVLGDATEAMSTALAERS